MRWTKCNDHYGLIAACPCLEHVLIIGSQHAGVSLDLLAGMRDKHDLRCLHFGGTVRVLRINSSTAENLRTLHTPST